MGFVKVSINSSFDSVILLKICIFFLYFCRKSVSHDYFWFLTKEKRQKTPVDLNFFKNLSKTHIFNFLWCLVNSRNFFDAKFGFPVQFLILYMCFCKVFWEKIEFAKKFEFSFEGKKVSAESGIEHTPYGLTANDLPLCYAVANFLNHGQKRILFKLIKGKFFVFNITIDMLLF